MDTCSDLKVEALDRFLDRRCAPHGSGRPIKGGEGAVACRVDLSAPEPFELPPHQDSSERYWTAAFTSCNYSKHSPTGAFHLIRLERQPTFVHVPQSFDSFGSPLRTT
jgi:hypothetical protein